MLFGAIGRLASVVFFGTAAFAQFQPIRINCGFNDYTATDGTVWLSDRYYVSGALLYTSDLIQGTNEQMLYRPGRYSLYSDFAYQIPVPNGSYNLKLKFAEIQYWAGGYRIFHVDVNGTRVLANYDIAAEVGPRRAVDKVFPVTVTNGQIRVDFTGVQQRGLINAIEVTQQTGPSISSSPASLTFAAIAGGANPAAQPVNVAVANGPANWSATTNATWLTASPAAGTTSGAVNITANITGLAASTYTGAVTITAAGAAGSPQTIPVTLNVAAPPTISASPTALSFAATAGAANPASKTFNVTVAGGTANWTTSSNAGWLTATPGTGTNSGAVTVNVNTAGLAAGTYTGAVAATAPGALGSPASVAVSLTVNPAVTLSPGAITFSGTAGGANPATQPVTLTVAGGTANWSASSNAGWLTASPGAGTTSGTLTLAANTAGLTAGTYNGAITVSGSNFTTQTVAVTLNVQASVSLSPTALSFTASAGGANPSPQPVALTLTGGPSAWSASSNAAWLTVTPGSGAASGALTAAANIAGLAAGNYAGTITVSGAGFATQTVSVALAVNGTVSLSPSALTFTGAAGGANPTSQPITLTVGGGSAAWTASSNATWLTVTPGSGTTSGTLAAAVNTAGLAAGTYSATASVSGASFPTQTVAVTLNVNPSVSLSPGTLTFTGTAGGANPASQPVTLTVTGGTANWSAASNAGWLSVSPAAGTTSGTLTVSANLTGLAASPQSGIITVSGPNFTTQTVAVTLNVSAQPTMSLAPGALTFTATAGGTNPTAQPVTLTTSGGAVNWTATSSAAWLTATPGAGTNSGSVSIAANIAALPAGTQTGAITFSAPNAASQTLNVTLNVQPSVTLSPGTLTFAGTAGGANPASQPVTLTVTGGTANWNAASNAGWLSVAPAAGTTSGALTVSANLTGLAAGPQSGIITVSGPNFTTQTVAVTLNVSAQPTMSLAPGALTFTATAGGTNPPAQPVTLTTSGGAVNWTATSNAAWLTATPGAGTNSGSVSIAANIAALPAGTQTGAITFSAPNAASQTLNVTLNVQPSVTLSPGTLTFTGTAGANPAAQPVTLTVTGGTSNWSVSSNAAWLTATPASGSASGALSVAVSTTGLPAGQQTGTISVTGANFPTQTVAVTLNVNPSVTLSPGTLTFTGTAGGANPASQPFTLTVTGGTANWSAASNAAWLTVTPGTGTASGSLTASVNTGSLAAGTQTAVITVSGPNFTSQTVNVTLNLGASFTLAPATLSFSGVAGGANPAAQSATLTVNGGPVNWSATPSAAWLQVSPAAGATSGPLSISVNTTGLAQGPQTGTISISGPNVTTQTLSVTLDVTAAPTITLTPSTLTFTATAGGANPASQNVALGISGGSLNWTATSNAAWLTATPASGSAAGTLAIGANITGLSAGTQTGTITVDAPGATSRTVSVTLNVQPSVTVSPGTLTFTGTAGGASPTAQSATLTVTGGTANWSAASNAAWLTVTPASGTASGPLSVSVNTTGLSAGQQTGAISITGANFATQTINVTLNVNPSVTLSPGTLTFTGTAGGANPASQPVTLTVTGGTANWSAASNAAWLTVTPASGATSGTLTANVNTASLAAGTQTAIITVSGPNFTSQTVNVTLNLAASFTLAPTTLSFTGVAGGSDPAAKPATLTVNGGPVNWTATPSAAWLLVAPASGTISGPLSVSVNTTGLAQGQQSGSITIAGPGVTSQTLNVTLDVTAAPTVTLAPATLTFTGIAGGSNPAAQSATVTVTGAANWTASSNAAWLTVTPASGSATGTLSVSVNTTGLTAGQQTGAISVSGANFTTQTLNVTLNVNPSVTLSPATLTFTAPVGGANPASQPITLTVTGGTANWSAASNAPWLTVSPASGTASGTLTASVNTAGMPGGAQSATITVSGPNFALQTVTVTLNLTNPGITLSPSLLTFSGVTGGANPASKTASLTAGGPVNWTASSNSPWLSVTPTTGSASTTLTISVNVAGLAAGSFDGNINVTAPGTTAQTILVTLTMTTPPSISVNPTALSFIGATNGAQPAPQTASVIIGGTGIANWTAVSNQTWLQVSPAGGSTSADVQISVSTTGLPTGVYTGTITFTAPTATGSPRTLAVTLNVAPPITVAPGGLTFFGTQGSTNPAAQSFNVQPTAATVAWSVANFRPYVTVTPSFGMGTGPVSVNVNIAGLAPGVYNDTIVVSAVNRDNAPAIVNLQLTVTASGQLPADFYVSPTGSPTNNGSITQPWDLATALAHPPVVRPGDRILLRSGTYGNGFVNFNARLVGSPTAPIVVRNYPGERARINGYLQVGCCDQSPDTSQGAYVWIWGLEIFNSNTDRTGCSAGPPCWGATPSRPGVDLFAPGARLINCIIHDTTQGLGFWVPATDAEAHGNLIYFNGYQAPDRAHGHGIYAQNNTTIKKITDNIIFDQFGYGLHLYGSGLSYIRNFLVEGNASFNNGVLSTGSQVSSNLLTAGGQGDAQGITVRANHFYFPPERDSGYNEMGFAWSGQNTNLVATDNYYIGAYEAADVWKWLSVTFARNTVYAKTWTKIGLDTGGQPSSSYIWNNNTYWGAGQFRFNGKWDDYAYWRSATNFDANSVNNTGDPTGVWTFVRPNRYETGRANIIVYNWALQGQVSVDLSNVLTAGQQYEIRDSQNFFGPAVASGTYTGGSVNIPMTGLTIAAPIGVVPTIPVHTGPKFAVFVVLPLGTAPLL